MNPLVSVLSFLRGDASRSSSTLRMMGREKGRVAAVVASPPLRSPQIAPAMIATNVSVGGSQARILARCKSFNGFLPLR
jgi:hypothetical protein